MGSYKIVTLLITPFITTHEPPSGDVQSILWVFRVVRNAEQNIQVVRRLLNMHKRRTLQPFGQWELERSQTMNANVQQPAPNALNNNLKP